jgi:hypothetical protein
MLDLQIDRLQVEINNAAGHEHRIRPVAERAVSLFAARLEERCENVPDAVAHVNAAPVNVDWNHMTDEQVAGAIAETWLGAVSARLKL